MRYFPVLFSRNRKPFGLDKTLKALCFSGRLLEAVELLCHKGSSVDHQTYAFLLQEAINRKESKLGRRIHTQMVTTGCALDPYLRTKLLILYAKTGDLTSAHHLFDGIHDRNLVSWNAMISGCVQKGLEGKGLDLYYTMRSVGMEPDQFTFASVFRACAGLASLDQGKRAHCVMIKTSKEANVVVHSALVDMYFKCSSPEDGHRAFEGSEERNVITWTALVTGYGQHGGVEEVLGLFHRMIEEGFRPNWITFLAVLSACSHGGLVDAGWKYFASMERDHGISPKREHYAVMVDMLGRAGRLCEAYEFIMSSPRSCREHSVIWGALLGACRLHGNVEMGKLAAKNFFEIQPANSGKHFVLSNTYAALEMWENVAAVRGEVRTLGITKEPAWSLIEVRGEIHTFLVGDKSHDQSELIYRTMDALHWALTEAKLCSILKNESPLLDLMD